MAVIAFVIDIVFFCMEPFIYNIGNNNRNDSN